VLVAAHIHAERDRLVMKRTAIGIALILCFLLLPPSVFADRSSPLIIDHTCTDLSQIPANWIEQAKSQIKWHYAHTSHGGQLTRGLQIVEGQDSTFSYSRSTSGLPTTSGALCILDGMRPYSDDSYITPNEYFSDDWQAPYHAHNLLNSSDYAGIINVSAFSWCTQMNYSDDSYVDNYLQAMNQLEQDNPGVTFVYLTGNAQCGPSNHYCSNLWSGYRRYTNNEQIREYCRNNNKVLFDFADIDSWWYNTDTNQWEQATYEYTVGDQTVSVPYEHPQYNLDQSGHTSNENCENKGKAVWHMMARLAGWGDCIEAPSDLSAQADSENQQIALSWTDNSTDTNEDSFIIQRQVDDGAWDNAYASVGADTTTYTDSGLDVGDYRYRVVAHLDNSGDGDPCDSGTSNEASAEITTQDDTDSDGDGVPDNLDGCPEDADKIEPGQCGCGVADTDSDSDGVADCNDQCPEDADKAEPGQCGCGVADTDSDSDGVADCNDQCPEDAGKTEPGQCGCGVADTDTDSDGVLDCNDQCPEDADKTEPGVCGCGVSDVDGDNDGTPDCNDQCPEDADKAEPGQCGCGVADTDSDSDGVADCNDQCPDDADKTAPGQCGCGEEDTDTDSDGVADCNDQCPEDPDKTDPGQCGCGISETDPCNSRPLPPVPVTPENASSGISLSPTISAGEFDDPDSDDVHDSTIWQISADNNFTELVCNETTQDDLISFTPSEPLTADSTYYWRVSYIDNRGAQSEWSEVFSFTTRAQDPTPDDDGGDTDSDEGNSTGCFIGVAGL
jgi:hypothetical protein